MMKMKIRHSNSHVGGSYSAGVEWIKWKYFTFLSVLSCTPETTDCDWLRAWVTWTFLLLLPPAFSISLPIDFQFQWGASSFCRQKAFFIPFISMMMMLMGIINPFSASSASNNGMVMARTIPASALDQLDYYYFPDRNLVSGFRSVFHLSYWIV